MGPRKWVCGLLSFIFPGLGHLYVGWMQRGLFFMLLLAGDIFGIVVFALKGIIPLIVLLSVMVPIIYFYSLFDALRAVDYLRGRRPYAPEYGRAAGGSRYGMLLVGIGIIVFALISRPDWLERIYLGWGPLIGGILFIGAGVGILLREAGKNK